MKVIGGMARCSCRLWMVFLLLIVCNGLASSTSSDFCSRSLNSDRCPNPPTVDSINILAYLGQWYEYGSSAAFKLVTESGLACAQARYSKLENGTLTLVNSGLKVLNPTGTSQVSAISLASSATCRQARNACTTLIAPHKPIASALRKLRHAAQRAHKHHSKIETSLKHLADDITASVSKTRGVLAALSDDITHIQLLGGKVSQGQTGSNPYKTPSRLLQKKAKWASSRLRTSSSILALSKILTQARTQVRKTANKAPPLIKAELDEVSSDLVEGIKQLLASGTGIEAGVMGIQGASFLLEKNTKPITDGNISVFNGVITQNASSAGKLTVRINDGMPSPYWILALEGNAKDGYKAALVYSCSANPFTGGVSKGLFILSRTTKLEEKVMDRFLSLAQSYGIYSDCDDAFVVSVQRGGTCGTPPS